MRQHKTLFLKGVICIMGLAVLALCIFVLPMMSKGAVVEYPNTAPLQYPFLLGMYVTAIAFFIALYQAFKLLNFIDNNTAFSELSIKALRSIKRCAIVISILYTANLSFFYQVAQAEDAPGVMVIGMVIALAPIVVATFAAVLQKLVQNAMDIQSENDLTV